MSLLYVGSVKKNLGHLLNFWRIFKGMSNLVLPRSTGYAKVTNIYIYLTYRHIWRRSAAYKLYINVALLRYVNELKNLTVLNIWK